MDNSQRTYSDTLRHQSLRKKLIKALQTKGITDVKVLEAMMEVPRHFFFDAAFDDIAYEDRAFSISICEDQTISQPYTVAYQTQLLELKPYEMVLEVGTGSGYQASILAALRGKVHTIERQRRLFDFLKNHYPLRKEYPSIKFFLGDGFAGLPKYGPFDKILVTAAAPFIPQMLIDQLKPGGWLVIPVGEGESQIMKRISKQPDGTYIEASFDNFHFVPMLPGTTSSQASFVPIT